MSERDPKRRMRVAVFDGDDGWVYVGLQLGLGPMIGMGPQDARLIAAMLLRKADAVEGERRARRS